MYLQADVHTPLQPKQLLLTLGQHQIWATDTSSHAIDLPSRLIGNIKFCLVEGGGGGGCLYICWRLGVATKLRSCQHSITVNTQTSIVYQKQQNTALTWVRTCRH